MQTLMNVLMAYTIVMRMQFAVMWMEVTTAHAILDSMEVAFNAIVSFARL